MASGADSQQAELAALREMLRDTISPLLADTVLPPFCTEHVYDWAREPKEKLLFEGANHCLDEVADEVYRAVHDWMIDRLREEHP